VAGWGVAPAAGPPVDRRRGSRRHRFADSGAQEQDEPPDFVGSRDVISGIRRPFPRSQPPWAIGVAVTVMVLGAAPVVSALAAPLPAAPAKAPQAAARGPAFQKDVLPIFQRNCLRCHARKVKKGG